MRRKRRGKGCVHQSGGGDRGGVNIEGNTEAAAAEKGETEEGGGSIN